MREQSPGTHITLLTPEKLRDLWLASEPEGDGRESDSGTLGSLGRLVFRKVVQVSDYFQSVSAEGKSGSVPGGEILKRK